MKKLVILGILFFNFLTAQNSFCIEKYKVEGIITDSITKEPIAEVLINIKEDNLYVISDKDGVFSFNTEKKTVTILCTAGGYKTYNKNISYPYEKIRIGLELSAEYTMGRVYVKDKKRIEGSKQKVRSEQIQKTTTSLFSDTYKVLQTLPGVVTGDNFSSLMYIRGGEYYESVSFMDNIHILNPYMWGGNQSIFNPSMVDKVDFYTGGFPAKYPMALSSVIDVKNIEGNFEKNKGYVDVLFPTTFEYFSEGPVTKDKSSYVFEVRRTYYDILANMQYEAKDGKEIVYPFFSDAQLKLVWKLNDKDKVYFNFIGSYEGMDFDSTAFDEKPKNRDLAFQFHYRIKQFLPALNWERIQNDKLSLHFTLSAKYTEGFADYKNENQTKITATQKEYDIYFNNKNTYLLDNHTIEQGLYIYNTWVYADTKANYRQIKNYAYEYNEDTMKFDWTKVKIFIAYIQDDITLIDEKLFANIGTTCEYFDYTNDTELSPRGGLKYYLAEKTALKFNTGLYSQFPISSKNEFPPFAENKNIKSEKAIHYILGVEQDLPEHFFVRAECYLKDYFDKIVRDPDDNLFYTNNGIRKAWGFDLFLQKKIFGKWDGWIAYSYLDAKDKIVSRTDLGGNIYSDSWQEPVNEWFPFSNERKHNLSIVLNKEFKNSKWKLALTYKYATGTPYTAIIGAQYNSMTDVYTPVYGKYLDARLPDYQNLDLKLNMPFFNIENAEFCVQVINVLCNKNINRYYYSDDYSQRYEAEMLSIIPFVGLKYYF